MGEQTPRANGKTTSVWSIEKELHAWKIFPEPPLRPSLAPTELFNPLTRITPRQMTANICCLVKGTAENGEDGYPQAGTVRRDSNSWQLWNFNFW